MDHDDRDGGEAAPAPEISSEFTSGTVDGGLRAMRARLLDLTGRNRLLNFRHSPKSTLRFVDAPIARVFDRLLDGDKLTIEEVPEPPPVPVSRPLFDGGQAPIVKPTAAEYARTIGWRASYDLDEVVDGEPDGLRTLHYSGALDSICRRIGSAARTAIEESGTNMLYLVFGFLEWFESDDSAEPRLAPLVTVPVILQRAATKNGSATLELSGDDVAPNLSLIERMKRDFGVEVPAWDEEEDLNSFFAGIERAVERKTRWRVRRQITLSLLSFGKLLMYRDLDPEVWPQIRGHAIVRELFEGRKSDAISHASEYTFDDERTPGPTPPDTVLDADSSQLSALVDAMHGRNLVIEGPPGTGKSQTISNLIAAALANEKTVLFVSEKLAALQVVRRRLDQAGLGLFCLELHSHKSRKDALLRDVEARIDAHGSFPTPGGVDAHVQKLERIKSRLRQYARLLQHRHEPLDCSLFQLVWCRERLSQQTGNSAARFDGLLVANVASIQRQDLDRIESNLRVYRGQLENLQARWPTPGDHPWAWVRTPLSFQGTHRLKSALAEVATASQELADTATLFAEAYGFDATQADVELAATVRRLDALPSPPAQCNFDLIEHCRGGEVRTALVSLVDQIRRWRASRDAITSKTTDDGLGLLRSENMETVPAALAVLSRFGLDRNRVADIETHVRDLERTQGALREALGAYGRLAHACEWSDPCASKSVTALASCLDLVATAPATDLHLRDPLFEVPGVQGLVDEAGRQSVEISAKIAGLSAEYDFALASSTGTATVRGHAHTVASASLFERWFGRRYREASSFCRLMSLRNAERKPKETARGLLDVAAAIEARERFASSPRFASAFQHLFRGLETDWLALGRLAAWYAKVGESLANLEDPSADVVRSTILKSPLDRILRVAKQSEILAADRKLLEGLRGVLDRLDAMGLGSTGSLAAEADAMISARVKGITEALGILRSLNLRHDMSLEALPELMRVAAEHQCVIRNLAANEKAQVAVRSTDWSQIDLGAVASTVEFATQIVDGGWPDRLLEEVLAATCLDAMNHVRRRVSRAQAAAVRLADAKEAIEGLSGNEDWSSSTVCFAQLASRASASVAQFDELATWCQWLSARAAVCNEGFESFIDLLERREIPPQDLWPGFQLAYHSNLIKSLLWEFRDSSLLSGLDQDEMRKQFRQADKEGIRLARARAAARIARRSVPPGRQTGPIKTWTELALISNEVSKQKRHIPIRQLIRRAGNALQALKPCFLMGPLSVAQYLPPGGLKFDLVVMDEASQLKPEDAIGAVARGGQLVVVGDPQQLPPTNFFQRVLQDEDETNDDRTIASEGESILDVASTLYQPIRRLRWHYRSRHESLIAFSNREFYDGKLLICPSAYDSHPELGVRYRPVRGIYENRRNPGEAAAVAQAVIDHVKSGSGHSLGVVALNFEQAELLEEVIERRLNDEPEARVCLELMEQNGEPFFVKNLENVQGDERDVIFVSCTYGPDPLGNQYQRFGPVNSADGHRRLNVLFTRAKRRCEVFSSLNPDKIHDDGKQRGVRVFKQYLKYAQTGRLESVIDEGGRGPESDFEESVGSLLRQEGHEVKAQVGVSGFWIDIGVRNPAKPGTYVLGVECDGKAYHSGRSARDRDRLRQEILENQGWKIHRIWSTDWFHSRQREVDRLLARVRQALESDPDYRDWQVRRQRQESVRTLLTELQEEITRAHSGAPAHQHLLRAEMFDAFMTRRPVSQDDWFRIPKPLREQTDSAQVRVYLPRILALFREASEWSG